MTATTSEIWNDFGDKLRRFIGQRVANPSDADDVLQDVFLKLHQRIDTLRDSERLAPWLYRITRNAVIDYYRARARGGDVPRDPPFGEQAEDGDEGGTAERQIAMYVAALVNDLPEKYRQALMLTELEGLTQEQMAERLQLSVSGAKSRVQRGRRMLRDQVLQCCHLEFDRRGRVIDYHSRATHCPGCEC